jgi:hypothetical protein
MMCPGCEQDNPAESAFCGYCGRRIPRLTAAPAAWGRRQRQRRRVKKAGDHGALVSIREAASDSKWQRYFQKLDDARYVKVIQQRIFRSPAEFLDDHDIDASSLVNRSETLIDNGVMVTGSGTLNAQAVAAGPSAMAMGHAQHAAAPADLDELRAALAALAGAARSAVIANAVVAVQPAVAVLL